MLAARANIEIESCFGVIKHNTGFRPFYLRGVKTVKTKITLIDRAHNLKKVYLRKLKKA
jgi:hypothetical protein